MKVKVPLVVLCTILLASCSEEPRSEEKSVAHNDHQKWPTIQRRENTVTITTSSGQNVTVYYADGITAVDVSFAINNDSLSKNNGMFLDFTENHLHRTGMMIGG